MAIVHDVAEGAPSRSFASYASDMLPCTMGVAFCYQGQRLQSPLLLLRQHHANLECVCTPCCPLGFLLDP